MCPHAWTVLSQDVLGSLRPQLARSATFEEASDAVAAIEAAEAAAEAAGLPAEESDSDETDTRRLGSDSEDGMPPIVSRPLLLLGLIGTTTLAAFPRAMM